MLRPVVCSAQRSGVRATARAFLARQMSSDAAKAPLVTVDRSDVEGVSIVKLARPPVNSLNTQLLTELNTTLRTLETDKSVRAAVLTSAQSGVFSAGIDILELYQRTPEQMRTFWTALQDTWLTLYGSPLVTIAAVNGHAPAGGCMLAMSCDYRIMSDKPVLMGLNETKLGIVAPFWFVDVFKATVGHRNAERLLQLGAMVDSHEALRIGLVDRLEPQEEVIPRATHIAKEWMSIPARARHASKLALRREAIDKLKANKEKDTENFVGFVSAPQVQEALGKYLASLSAKKAPKA